MNFDKNINFSKIATFSQNLDWLKNSTKTSSFEVETFRYIDSRGKGPYPEISNIIDISVYTVKYHCVSIWPLQTGHSLMRNFKISSNEVNTFRYINLLKLIENHC